MLEFWLGVLFIVCLQYLFKAFQQVQDDTGSSTTKGSYDETSRCTQLGNSSAAPTASQHLRRSQSSDDVSAILQEDNLEEAVLERQEDGQNLHRTRSLDRGPGGEVQRSMVSFSSWNRPFQQQQQQQLSKLIRRKSGHSYVWAQRPSRLSLQSPRSSRDEPAAVQQGEAKPRAFYIAAAGQTPHARSSAERKRRRSELERGRKVGHGSSRSVNNNSQLLTSSSSSGLSTSTSLSHNTAVAAGATFGGAVGAAAAGSGAGASNPCAVATAAAAAAAVADGGQPVTPDGSSANRVPTAAESINARLARRDTFTGGSESSSFRAEESSSSIPSSLTGGVQKEGSGKYRDSWAGATPRGSPKADILRESLIGGAQKEGPLPDKSRDSWAGDVQKEGTTERSSGNRRRIRWGSPAVLGRSVSARYDSISTHVDGPNDAEVHGGELPKDSTQRGSQKRRDWHAGLQRARSQSSDGSFSYKEESSWAGSRRTLASSKRTPSSRLSISMTGVASSEWSASHAGSVSDTAPSDGAQWDPSEADSLYKRRSIMGPASLNVSGHSRADTAQESLAAEQRAPTRWQALAEQVACEDQGLDSFSLPQEQLSLKEQFGKNPRPSTILSSTDYPLEQQKLFNFIRCRRSSADSLYMESEAPPGSELESPAGWGGYRGLQPFNSLGRRFYRPASIITVNSLYDANAEMDDITDGKRSSGSQSLGPSAAASHASSPLPVRLQPGNRPHTPTAYQRSSTHHMRGLSWFADSQHTRLHARGLSLADSQLSLACGSHLSQRHSRSPSIFNFSHSRSPSHANVSGPFKGSPPTAPVAAASAPGSQSLTPPSAQGLPHHPAAKAYSRRVTTEAPDAASTSSLYPFTSQQATNSGSQLHAPQAWMRNPLHRNSSSGVSSCSSSLGRQPGTLTATKANPLLADFPTGRQGLDAVREFLVVLAQSPLPALKPEHGQQQQQDCWGWCSQGDGRDSQDWLGSISAFSSHGGAGSAGSTLWQQHHSRSPRGKNPCRLNVAFGGEGALETVDEQASLVAYGQGEAYASEGEGHAGDTAPSSRPDHISHSHMQQRRKKYAHAAAGRPLANTAGSSSWQRGEGSMHARGVATSNADGSPSPPTMHSPVCMSCNEGEQAAATSHSPPTLVLPSLEEQQKRRGGSSASSISVAHVSASMSADVQCALQHSTSAGSAASHGVQHFVDGQAAPSQRSSSVVASLLDMDPEGGGSEGQAPTRSTTHYTLSSTSSIDSQRTSAALHHAPVKRYSRRSVSTSALESIPSAEVLALPQSQQQEDWACWGKQCLEPKEVGPGSVGSGSTGGAGHPDSPADQGEGSSGSGVKRPCLADVMGSSTRGSSFTFDGQRRLVDAKPGSRFKGEAAGTSSPDTQSVPFREDHRQQSQGQRQQQQEEAEPAHIEVEHALRREQMEYQHSQAQQELLQQQQHRQEQPRKRRVPTAQPPFSSGRAAPVLNADLFGTPAPVSPRKPPSLGYTSVPMHAARPALTRLQRPPPRRSQTFSGNPNAGSRLSHGGSASSPFGIEEIVTAPVARVGSVQAGSFALARRSTDRASGSNCSHLRQGHMNSFAWQLGGSGSQYNSLRNSGAWGSTESPIFMEVTSISGSEGEVEDTEGSSSSDDAAIPPPNAFNIVAAALGWSAGQLQGDLFAKVPTSSAGASVMDVGKSFLAPVVPKTHQHQTGRSSPTEPLPPTLLHPPPPTSLPAQPQQHTSHDTLASSRRRSLLSQGLQGRCKSLQTPDASTSAGVHEHLSRRHSSMSASEQDRLNALSRSRRSSCISVGSKDQQSMCRASERQTYVPANPATMLAQEAGMPSVAEGATLQGPVLDGQHAMGGGVGARSSRSSWRTSNPTTQCSSMHRTSSSATPQHPLQPCTSFFSSSDEQRNSQGTGAPIPSSSSTRSSHDQRHARQLSNEHEQAHQPCLPALTMQDKWCSLPADGPSLGSSPSTGLLPGSSPITPSYSIQSNADAAATSMQAAQPGSSSLLAQSREASRSTGLGSSPPASARLYDPSLGLQQHLPWHQRQDSVTRAAAYASEDERQKGSINLRKAQTLVHQGKDGASMPPFGLATSATSTGDESAHGSQKKQRSSRVVRHVSMHYSDNPRHKGRMRALLITKEALKDQAIRAALPPVRYEVKTVASHTECLTLLNSRSKYLPDVVLLDGQFGQHLPAHTRHTAAAREDAQKSMASSHAANAGLKTGSHQRWSFQASRMSKEMDKDSNPESVDAWELLALMRKLHDPSVLPVILLATPEQTVQSTTTMAAATALVDAAASFSSASSPVAAGVGSAHEVAKLEGKAKAAVTAAAAAGVPVAGPPPPLGQLQSLAVDPKQNRPVMAELHTTSTHSGTHSALASTPSQTIPSSAPDSVQAKTATDIIPPPDLCTSISIAREGPQHAPSPSSCTVLSEEDVLSSSPCAGEDKGSRPLSQRDQSQEVQPMTTASSATTQPSDSQVLLEKLQPRPQAERFSGHSVNVDAPPISAPVAASSVLLSNAVSTDGPSPLLPGAAPPSITSAAQEGVAALRQGANDYVVLPVLPTELEARINMQVALRRAVRIKAEASSSMQLLRSMLPGHVIRRLKAGQTYIAQHHEQVTIAFIDVVGFTDMSAHWPSSKVAQMLNDLFASFDDICDRHGVYHVDTIGDGYMVLCGHDGEQDHTLRLLRTAREMIELTQSPLPHGERVRVRIGLNTGPAHSGVLGTKRLKYTVWGDSVNCASRMESTGFAGSIQVSSDTHAAAFAQMGIAQPQAAQSRPRFSLERGSNGNQSHNAANSFSSAGASSQVYSREALLQPVEQDTGSIKSGPASASGHKSPEFGFVALGERTIKGKGLLFTYLVMDGDWEVALANYRAIQRQAWSPTPEGLKAHRAGFEEGFRAGLGAANTQAIHTLGSNVWSKGRSFEADPTQGGQPSSLASPGKRKLSWHSGTSWQLAQAQGAPNTGPVSSLQPSGSHPSPSQMLRPVAASMSAKLPPLLDSPTHHSIMPTRAGQEHSRGPFAAHVCQASAQTGTTASITAANADQGGERGAGPWPRSPASVSTKPSNSPAQHVSQMHLGCVFEAPGLLGHQPHEDARPVSEREGKSGPPTNDSCGGDVAELTAALISAGSSGLKDSKFTGVLGSMDDVERAAHPTGAPSSTNSRNTGALNSIKHHGKSPDEKLPVRTSTSPQLEVGAKEGPRLLATTSSSSVKEGGVSLKSSTPRSKIGHFFGRATKRSRSSSQQSPSRKASMLEPGVEHPQLSSSGLFGTGLFAGPSHWPREEGSPARAVSDLVPGSQAALPESSKALKSDRSKVLRWLKIR